MKGRVTKCDVLARMSEKILILDGAMGTSIQKYNLTPQDFLGGKGNNDILNITREDVIEQIHNEFIAAGADIIETNTFSGNAISQKDYGQEGKVYEINLKGAQIARKAADAAAAGELMMPGTGEKMVPRKVLVAGSMGPTVKSLSLSPDVNEPQRRDVSFEQMANAYKEQVEALCSQGIAQFHGFQSDPRPYYAAADCLVLPSYHEGMSNVLLEAAATGRPLVTSYIPGCREAVEEGRTGFTCRPRDPESLYEAMKKVIALSREDRVAMGLAGRARMEEIFDKNAVVETTLNAIFRD